MTEDGPVYGSKGSAFTGIEKAVSDETQGSGSMAQGRGEGHMHRNVCVGCASPFSYIIMHVKREEE